MQQKNFYRILKPLAKKEGLKFDFFSWERENFSVSFENKKLVDYFFSEDQNFCIRLMKKGRVGSSYTKNLSSEKIRECFNQALLSLKASDRESEGRLPSPQKFQALFDNLIKGNMPIKKRIALVKAMDKAASDKGKTIQSIQNSFWESKSRLFFGNSEEACGDYSAAHIGAFSYSLAQGKKHKGQGKAYKISRDYKDITKALGGESAKKAIQKADSLIPKTKTYPVLFKGEWGSPVLLWLLLQHLHGKRIYENLSLLKDSLGQKKFSKYVTLIDDPFASWGKFIRPFDGEGYASQKTLLIDKGIVRNYLTNSFISKKLKAPHTAKAQRLENGRLSVAPTNSMMLAGSSSLKNMRETFKEVVEVDFLKGLAGYNNISGDFSIESEGFLWSGGEARPITQFTISGNIIHLFANILKAGKDSYVGSNDLKAPAFLVPELSIAGK